MVEVAIQLSDETLARLKTRAEALEITPEQVIADAVHSFLDVRDPWLGFATEGEYRDFVQEGIDSADRGELEDFDVVAARLRAELVDLIAERAR
jgi:predicted transcriptional regulator